MFEVVTPTGDYTLLSAAELRTAIGLSSTDTGEDAKLGEIGPMAFAAITRACRVMAEGVKVPTLRKETLRDTFRSDRHYRELILSRRPIVSITSIVEGETTLETTDYEIEAGAGMLKRLSSDNYTRWACGKIVVTYLAGYDVVPDDLKDAAARLVNTYYLSGTDDPLEKSVELPDIGTVQRWVDKDSDAGMPDDILAALQRGGYVNVWVG